MTRLPIEGGNSVRFEARSEQGRIHLEGTGPIVVEVSVDGTYYEAIEHTKEFVNGKCESPWKFYIGDHVRISATTLTDCLINFNRVENGERR